MAQSAASLNAPIRYDVDLCFVGANSAAVAAAAKAAAAGLKVLVLAERAYLGEDLTGSLRLQCAADDRPRSTLATSLFGADGSERPSPLEAKLRLDDALLSTKADFLYGCFPYALLRNDAGDAAGVVMASRGGLFAVKARIVVDATWRANLARSAGIAFTPYAAGEYTFEQVVVGGAAHPAPGVTVSSDAEPVTVTLKDGEHSYTIHRYQMRLAMEDGSPRSFANAEVSASSRTFDPGQQRVADMLWQIPPDAVVPGAKHVATWSDSAALDAFRTTIPGLWIAGPCADCSREAAAALVRPATFLAFGERLTAELVTAARSAKPGAGLTPVLPHAEHLTSGCLRTEQDSLRNISADTVAIPIDRVPVFGDVDVLVMGGGTAGASAGIGAARKGARTLVCEYQSALGGVGTVGMIAKYYFGNRVGFTSQIDAGTLSMGPAEQAPGDKAGWRIEWKQRWYQAESARSGAEVWYGSIGCGALVTDGAVRGVLVATPWGTGLVRCAAVVDASGNADIPAHAGAPTEVIGADHVATQGTGLGPRQPGHDYRNTDWTFIDDTDVVDTTQAMVIARMKFRGEFDTSALVDSRERRRIVGELSMSPLDFLARRTFPDTVVTANSNFDTHGFTIHPLFLIEPPDKKPLDAHVPFRCMLPKGLKGVVVTGLGKCAHRDALPVIRMQPDVQNEGYAMGVATAMAAAAKCDVRDIDFPALQKHLVEVGILAADVPAHRDNFPLPADRIAEAIADPMGFINLAVIFSQGEQAIPALRTAHAAASGEPRVRYAQILGLLGDASGADDLAAAIAGQDWDAGWNFRGMGQYGRSASPLDALIIALGASGAVRHGTVIVDKIRAIGPDHHQSHSRAVAQACEALPLPAAAEAMAGVLKLPGVAGHHQHQVLEARDTVSKDSCETETRNNCLREIHLARALYRIGDHQGLGEKILKAYADDLRGTYARHARAVLAEGKRVRSTAAVA